MEIHKTRIFFNDFGKTLNVDFLKSWEIQKTWIFFKDFGNKKLDFLKILEIKKLDFLKNLEIQKGGYLAPPFFKSLERTLMWIF